ncbi:LysR family transcriptional regulator [Pendulispora brunnea]|uniref:LysR family transcriptional regulator n=1 Tax=Pendulispora brunnea TaxID=2905690 RepID=A0ABZ2KM15_9BACT
MAPVSIDDLRVVVAVAEHGSFVLAARHTRVPTSTVSRAVARFEDAAGVRLFQRNSRKVSLTAEGAMLLERAAPLLEEMDRLVEGLAGEEASISGRLRVTAPTMSGSRPIAAALMSFAEAHPKVTVELSLTNAVVDLLEEGFDLAFRAGPVHGADLVARRVWSVPYALGASPAFVEKELARRKKLDRAALESLPAIAARPDTVWRFRRDDNGVTTIRPRIRFCVSDLRVGIDAAARGLGIVGAARHELLAAGLVLLEPKADVGRPEARELYAVYPSRRLLPKRVALAIDWVARALRDAER